MTWAERGRAPHLAVAVIAALLTGPLSAAAPTGAANGPDPGGPATASVPSGPVGGAWLGMSDGRLAYGQDAQGNRVPDYSFAGYGGGGTALPRAAVKVTVPAPGTGDATAAVQAAIDQVSALAPDSSGLRGAVQLAPGTYRIAGQLRITAGGVVLRGAGTGPSGTTVAADGPTIRTLITVGANASYTTVGTVHQVADPYVPVGATALTLDSAAGLSVGDEVVIERPTTQAWIDALGMTGIWTPDWSLRAERRITAVQGSRITFDVPLTTALEKQYTQATVYRYTFPRVSRTGVESLSLDGQSMTSAADYPANFYNAAPWEFRAVQDSWITDVVWRHFGGSGQTALGPQSRRVSVLRTQALDMVTTDSSARSEAYLLQGQQNLIQDCAVTAAKIHAFSTYGRQSGPNVFSRCTATLVQTTYDAGGHQRWGSGTLYDNVRVDGSLLLVNNGTRGSGHGWSDANSTAYNCTTQEYKVQEPPTAHNWAFGCTGSLLTGSDGQVVSNGTRMVPGSLYDQQLVDRGRTVIPAPVAPGRAGTS
ncbi:peptidoglycan-binding protein [Streptomyces sp. NPDC094448]|uniref:peptidoglycan-binding protein n=1 Tax=Streptomyces sp. NPDC094448 TaxID=3366063 RepID=UPI003806109B